MNILIVDDDASAREALAQVLEPLCADGATQQAESAGVALTTLAQGFLADLVVCDVRMPDTSGIELLDRLRQDIRYSALPVMMITASPDQTVVRQAMQLRVQGFILKPASADAALRARAALERFHAALLEDPHQVCKRLPCTLRQYESALDALLNKVGQLVQRMQHWSAGEVLVEASGSTLTSAALEPDLVPCVTGARLLGLPPLLKTLQSLERLVSQNVEPQDERAIALAQALALQRQWLTSYRGWRHGVVPHGPRAAPQRLDRAAPNPLIRIPPVKT